MTSTTDTRPVQNHTEPSDSGPSRTARPDYLTWAFVIAAMIIVAALAAVTFIRDDVGTGIPAVPIDPRAEVYERQAKLAGQARTYSRVSGPLVAPAQTTNLTAIEHAERIERQAHLAGQDRTYSQEPAVTPSAAGRADEPEFVPGTRRMPTR